ncbi:succinate dehydrogenase [Phreatobacter sp.]|uniref:succinate dehydrogenase n=1 Tax=Phreatobacter sp. TaxID=1966341 RepID=UPI0025D6E560|nr:succinate dehydrogenase [Phreatobacter sp.]
MRRAPLEARLWLAQRASAAVLALCVVVHLATMLYAVRGGLTAAEILGRTRESMGWLCFYGLFVAAVAVHAPLGLRAILREWTPLRGRPLDAGVAAFAVLLVVAGWRAVGGLFR